MNLDDLAADGFGHWFAGFVDGEGCFLIYGCTELVRKCVCRLVIEVRLDELSALQEIQRRLGIGVIQQMPKLRTPRSAPLVRWQVTSREACAEVVAVLDRFPLRAKKARDFAVWREAVGLWLERQRGDDWSPMRTLKEELSRVRVYAVLD